MKNEVKGCRICFQAEGTTNTYNSSESGDSLTCSLRKSYPAGWRVGAEVWHDRRGKRKNESCEEDSSRTKLISDYFYLLLTILDIWMGMDLVGIQWKILTPKRLTGKVPWRKGHKVTKLFHSSHILTEKASVWKWLYKEALKTPGP